MALAPEGTRAMRGCRPVGAKPRPVRRFHQQGPCHDGKAPPTMVKHGEKLCLNGNSGSSETRGNLPPAGMIGRDRASRSEEGGVGKEGVSTCRSRCAPVH